MFIVQDISVIVNNIDLLQVLKTTCILTTE